MTRFFLSLTAGSARITQPPNYTHAVEGQAQHIAQTVAAAHMKVSRPLVSTQGEKSGVVIEAEIQAEEAWSMLCASGATRFAAMSICGPSYMNKHSKQSDTDDPAAALRLARGAGLAEGVIKYHEILHDWREAGTMEGVLVSGVAA